MNIFLIFIIVLFFLLISKNKIEYYSCNLPKYLPKIWNTNKNNIKRYNNCYAYAMRDLKLNRKKKPQPGELCGLKKINKKQYQNKNVCDNFYNRIKCDYSGDNKISNFFKINENDKCPCNYYKIALFIDDRKNNEDYHFYRQDDNKFWSHKSGRNRATNLDASNNIIIHPSKSNKKYKNHNYNKLCGYYCKKYFFNENIDK